MEAALLKSFAALANLFFCGPKAYPLVTGPMHTALSIWVQVRGISRKDATYSPHMPLWGNSQRCHLTQIPGPQLWQLGVVALKDVITDRRIFSFAVMRDKFSLPLSMSFCYFQLYHALHAQLQELITLEPNWLKRRLTLRIVDKPLSSLYLRLLYLYAHTSSKTFDKWKTDIPELYL